MERPAWTMQWMWAALELPQPGSVVWVESQSERSGGSEIREETWDGWSGMAGFVVASAGHWPGVVVLVDLHATWTTGHLHCFDRTAVLVRVGCGRGSDTPCEAWHILGRILGSTCS
jgi:hypothetical protein